VGDAENRRPRGRPKQTPADPAGAGFSLENPTDSLPVSARAILSAARAVLHERGFEGLTIEAVANEANVSRSSIPYHFGSRSRLVELLIDSLFHDLAVEIWRLRQAGDAGGDLASYLELVRREGHDVASQRDFFELMVLALRDAELRRRVAELFGEYRDIDLDLAGIGAGASPQQRAATGAVLQAIADGLALQAAIDPAFDLDAAVDAARTLLGRACSESFGD